MAQNIFILGSLCFVYLSLYFLQRTCHENGCYSECFHIFIFIRVRTESPSLVFRVLVLSLKFAGKVHGRTTARKYVTFLSSEPRRPWLGSFVLFLVSVRMLCCRLAFDHINMQKVVNKITLPTSSTMIKRNRFTEMAEN